ncbi:MAG: phosphotransferase [Chloroflexi bacterium]|nr:phosphotransferase [Chloroflexota bacterium]
MNRLLRRVDWRWLLGTPKPNRSLCFADGLLAEAVQFISTRVVRAARPPAASCELAVAVDPTASQLRAAWDALRPGGGCYTEWHTPLAGSARAIQRRLEGAGFEVLAQYWPRFGTTSPRIWVPLRLPSAIQHVVQAQPKGHGAAARLARSVVERSLAGALRSGMVRPVCVLARKPGAERTDLLSVARDEWCDWGFGPAPGQLDCLLLTLGPRSLNKVVGLLFADAEPRPRLAIKIARTHAAAAALRREAAALPAVAAQSGTVSGVPRLIFFRDQPGQCLLGESALDGRPLYAQLRRETYRDLTLKTVDWLIALAGRPVPRQRAQWWERLVEPRLSEFCTCFRDIVDDDLLTATRARLASLGTLPLVPEQRDLWSGNVLVDDDGQVSVLDWEDAEPSGLPALDLFYLLADLAFMFEGAFTSTSTARFLESYRASRNPTTFTGSISTEALARYSAGIGLDACALRPLRLLTWLPHAAWEYRQLAAERGPRAARVEVLSSRFLQLWREELRAS